MKTAHELATELEDKIFLAMLDLSRSNAGPEFDLQTLCNELQIDADPMSLIGFTSDNEGFRGSRNVTTTSIRFTMNAEGRRHALALEKSFRPKSFGEKVKAVGPEWYAVLISLLSLGVSFAALFRDNN